MLTKLADAHPDQLEALGVACNGCDGACEAEFDEMLEDVQAMALAERDIRLFRKIRKIRKRPRQKKKLYDQTMDAAKLSLLNSGRLGEFGDGEFARWFIEWFSEEGWQIIIEFIKALAGIFGFGVIGYLVAVGLAVEVFGAAAVMEALAA